MNTEERGVLIGMVLGDGHIRTATAKDKIAKRRISPQITFSHSAKQKEYAGHKVSILNNIFGGNATLRNTSYIDKNGKEHFICYAAKSNPYFRVLKNMMYTSGKKKVTNHVLDMLTDNGIAIWFMDDGSYRINRKLDGNVSSVSLIISTYCSKEEVDNIINYFTFKYDIIFKPAFCNKTKLWYIRANTLNSRKFAGLIEPYIVDSMKYKISCIHKLDEHECLKPEKTCVVCGKKVVVFKAKEMCHACYDKQWKLNRVMI